MLPWLLPYSFFSFLMNGVRLAIAFLNFDRMVIALVMKLWLIFVMVRFMFTLRLNCWVALDKSDR
jgi:hypothetical protein